MTSNNKAGNIRGDASGNDGGALDQALAKELGCTCEVVSHVVSRGNRDLESQGFVAL